LLASLPLRVSLLLLTFDYFSIVSSAANPTVPMFNNCSWEFLLLLLASLLKVAGFSTRADVISMLLLASLHAVAGLTTSASIPAVVRVATVLAVVLFLSFLLILMFLLLLWW
jgi:uncharacterized membrane protein